MRFHPNQTKHQQAMRMSKFSIELLLGVSVSTKISNQQKDKKCSISASYITIFTLIFDIAPVTHGSWSAAGKGGMHRSAQYPPTSWSESRQAPAGSHSCLLHSCIYPDWCDTNTWSPPPPFGKKLGRREGTKDLLRQCLYLFNKIIFYQT